MKWDVKKMLQMRKETEENRNHLKRLESAAMRLDFNINAINEELMPHKCKLNYYQKTQTVRLLNDYKKQLELVEERLAHVYNNLNVPTSDHIFSYSTTIKSEV